MSENEDEVEGLSQRETDFWEFSKKEAEGISLLQKIAKLRSRGINIEPIIDSLLQ